MQFRSVLTGTQQIVTRDEDAEFQLVVVNYLQSSLPLLCESQSMLNSTDYQIKSTIEPDEP
jgi:hypothetical protein